MIETKLKVMGNTLDDKKESLNAESIQSDVDVNKKTNNKYVSLVMEKMENYEERKNRMNRRKDIRKGIQVTLDEVRFDFLFLFVLEFIIPVSKKVLFGNKKFRVLSIVENFIIFYRFFSPISHFFFLTGWVGGRG
jgi:hypothetical protein